MLLITCFYCVFIDLISCGEAIRTTHYTVRVSVFDQLKGRARVSANSISRAKTDEDFRAQLQGFSLTTAEIIYRLPDYPALVQSYIWQEYDLAPRFPKLKRFLEFWTAKLDGKLYKVTVAHAKLIRPAELRLLDAEFKLN